MRNDATFVYQTTIDTTPERLWQALTSGAITRAYWFDRRIESDWAIGSPVRFYDGDSDLVTDSGEVLECDPPRRLVYSFALGGAGPATRVSFELQPQPDGVRLRLLHDRLATPEDVDGWRQGWTPILANLAALLEGREPTAAPSRPDPAGTPTVTRRIPRPPAVVFAALTDPDAMTRWWRPAGASTEVHELDARPGGRLALTVTLGGGVPVRLSGVYREAAEPETLVHTLRAEGDDRESLVTWRLWPDGAGTLLELTDSLAGPDEAGGWAEGVDNLVELLAVSAAPR